MSPPPARPPVLAHIALGANLGDARAAVRAALAQLAQHPLWTLEAASGLYLSPPWQAEGPDYINAVAAVRTRLNACELLAELQALERQAGRERPYPNAPRTLDLDLLLYGDGQIHSPHLTVPHPRLWERAFVVLPLAEIAPQRVSAAQWAAVADQTIRRLGGFDGQNLPLPDELPDER